MATKKASKPNFLTAMFEKANKAKEAKGKPAAKPAAKTTAKKRK